jgi:hypothetical protein
MYNTERREALARARRQAVAWAEKAEERASWDHQATTTEQNMSRMWAAVADSLKIGNDSADSTND